ncbi:MAG TPA: TlyA family RNA methyltransferase [Polyangiaceae bacterium]|nr:TlyA family RNA methyltransferase [Polyangiaceae bacterium]
MPRERADQALVRQGLAPSRTRAQALIREGRVTLADGRAVERPGMLLGREVVLRVSGPPGFVSRGGDKLDRALPTLAVDPNGKVVVDVGASTGGFTDAVLRRGAARVYAVDVGRDQLDRKLREDPRVVVRDGVNARHLGAGDFPEPVDLVVVDASFISLGKLAPALRSVVRPGGELVALVKPQFEAGREAVREGRGVIRDAEVRDRAIEGAREALASAGFVIRGECDSEVPGPEGNVEHFVYATRPV